MQKRPRFRVIEIRLLHFPYSEVTAASRDRTLNVLSARQVTSLSEWSVQLESDLLSWKSVK